MKNLAFTTNPNDKFQKRNTQNLSSKVVEEMLKMTYPNYDQLFNLKKEELYGYIFNYFFNTDNDDMFYKIGSFTNMMTASCLKGFQLIIQKNNLNSFEALDLHMDAKKTRSFILLGSKLTEHEVLDEKEKSNIIGGKKMGQQSTVSPTLYFYPNKVRTA